MKKNISFSIIFLLTSTLLLTISCTNKNKSEPLNVDELLTNASSLVGETVVVEGLCIHVCKKRNETFFARQR